MAKAAAGPQSEPGDKMNDRPAISVLIPTYNRAHMVGRAIQSVLSQTFRDLELIVVDDGSTDDTEDVIRGFHDPRIRHIRHQENKGAQAARNTGLKAVRGAYISFLDSDDEWLPEKLERQLEVFNTNPHHLDNLGVVMTGRHVQSETGERSQPAIYDGYGHLHSDVFLRKVHGQMPALVRHDVFEQAGDYDESLPAAQDWDMLVRLAEICQFDVARERLYVRHNHGGDRVRTTENVIKAYRILFRKYGKTFALYPKYSSRLRAYLSSRCLERNARQEARQEAWLAIKLDPFQGRAYGYLALSLVDGRVYRTVAGLKKRWLSINPSRIKVQSTVTNGWSRRELFW